MGTITHFEEDLYPPNGVGIADTAARPTTVELLVTSFYGTHQIFLILRQGDNEKATYHLTKLQAAKLSKALDIAESGIAYDNTIPYDPNAAEN